MTHTSVDWRTWSVVASASIAFASSLCAQATGRSADIQDIRYDITFDHIAAASRTVKVAMTFDIAGPGPVILSLPEWTPGAYETSNFARWTFDFTAKGDGRDLT